jgi:hypothetical protein
MVHADNHPAQQKSNKTRSEQVMTRKAHTSSTAAI